MVTVRTKAALKRAIENKQFPIRCTGEIADQIKNFKKKKKRTKRSIITGGALALGGLAAIPFTGGASAIATGAGLTAMGLTIGGGVVAISAAELAILVGGSVAIYAILKGRKVKLQPDGTVIVE